MTFTNRAALLCEGHVVLSNIVTGERVPSLFLRKAASAAAYEPGGQLQYTLTITNTAPTPFAALTLLDDLGRYLFMGFPRFPLSYIEGSATLELVSASGTAQGMVTATQNEDGVLFAFALPANTTVLLRYRVTVSAFASPAAGYSITNVAVLQGEGLPAPLKATLTLPVAEQARLAVAKTAHGIPEEGQPFTFTLVVLNYGNVPVTAADFVVLSDPLDPPLAQLTVTANGVPWTQGVQYQYEDGFFYFRTESGAIELDAATVTQNDFGTWVLSPAALVLTLTGVVASSPMRPARMEVLPAYADGREASLQVERVRPDLFRLSGTGEVPPAFMLLTQPSAPLQLLAGSDPRFTLQGQVLQVDADSLAQPVSAFVSVRHGAGYTVTLEYTP